MRLRACALLFLVAGALSGQAPFEQEGYVEWRAFGFPDETYNDRSHFLGEAVIHYDVSFGLAPGLKLKGATETRMDTHHQTEREFRINIDDRGRQRPNFSIRRISLQYEGGPVTFEAGKQIIDWGTTAILAPTDRFTPQDYLFVAEPYTLAVNAARIEYAQAGNSVELVVQPIFTPSRIPLLNQRWTPIPEGFSGMHVVDVGSRIPKRTQWGARWKRSTRRYEAAVSIFDGFNHLPLIHRDLRRDQIEFERIFPRMRMYGAELAVPLRQIALKVETAYFTSPAKDADDYALYVLQLEQRSTRWSWTAGYAGEWIVNKRARLQFAPDRALARGFVSRGSYQLTKTRGISAQTYTGANGFMLRSEYREEWGQHWSGAVGYTLLRGQPSDFFGQYRRNSFFNLSLRYSFE